MDDPTQQRVARITLLTEQIDVPFAITGRIVEVRRLSALKSCLVGSQYNWKSKIASVAQNWEWCEFFCLPCWTRPCTLLATGALRSQPWMQSHPGPSCMCAAGGWWPHRLKTRFMPCDFAQFFVRAIDRVLQKKSAKRRLKCCVLTASLKEIS